VNLLLPEPETIATASPVEFDTSGWPTWDEALRQLGAEAVLAAVEQAAAPVTGALPVIVPLTKADAHEGTVEAVLMHACDRLREISRTGRISQLAAVVATLEAVI
jgi:hypothetical protein